MMFTEEEARDKRCPANQTAATLRWMESGDTGGIQFCTGSECMAWRIEYGTWHLGKEQFLVAGESFRPDEVVSAATGRGYCGLAGRPE